ncbi:diaminopimelate decarboxylase [Desulfatibacillum alkenivorans DSM 16219]|jgi:diaminopimelate decarboxylase|uniref:Diaminopimelate decarboxylase n=1 Tax=Desulfatibacillum alkenivorans DSM 16219 TaxID=1121393 RepID=A0A1M6LWB7_9BACT|nr:alanine racemase [Desulfatibacillum alkenivorans]SHJ75450.1 diaminopimelate decarboxylase [Desulfatibacillum alkenivorans DSM 16219]
MTFDFTPSQAAFRDALSRVEAMLRHKDGRLPGAMVKAYVERFFNKKEVFLDLAEVHQEPLYVLDHANLKKHAAMFKNAFAACFPDFACYYAMKSNNHPEVSRILVNQGFGLDVSSGVEVERALALGAEDVIFSGPGKTDKELFLAVENSGRVKVLMDSLGEMERLNRLALQAGKKVRVGLRITPPSSPWKKFGVALANLGAAWKKAQECPGLEIQGLQFHTSWNLDPSQQVRTIAAIGREVGQWSPEMLGALKFLDIGGGYWPQAGEWQVYPVTQAGQVMKLAGLDVDRPLEHYYAPAQSLEVFAQSLYQAVETHIFSTVPCRVCMEPGRWLCNGAMHLLLNVVDKKDGGLVITDAGTNAVGWERYEMDYAPVLNLSRPALEEKACEIMGSLCTPHDLWGLSYWGQDIQPGDVLLIPDQGAYTYSLKQDFIKAPPRVISMPEK